MDMYIRWKENNRLPDTPPLVLELDGSPTLWTEGKIPTYSFTITLRRVLDDQQFWFRWESSIDPRKEEYILISHDPDSGNIEKVGIEDHSRYLPLLPTIHQFPDEPASFYVEEAKNTWDRSTINMRTSLPEIWARLVEPGRTYTLLWTGKEITYWDWGTPQQKKETKTKWPPILVPGGAHLTFTVREGRKPQIPSPPTPPPISPSDRVPGAPVLSLELSCSSTMSVYGDLNISTRVIYHSPSSDNESSQPITFHTWAFNPFDAFRVYRRLCPNQSDLKTENEWERFENDRSPHVFWDNPDRELNVAESEEGRFVTLYPGESWSNSWSFDLPDDLRPGEQLRYQFKGNTLDWWDWGTAEDHAQSIVTLPGSGIEPISHPKDNNNRPKAVIPASNVVEWTMSSD
ncbi:uncharacterized protein BO66DRAFT_349530 [Aspergillus aculeatinus CBS 121060]|uniref:Uncharacterized protein n=1 Tax=Aspergillus aculeatinus CBS 121060 TaxID=1448322 RepID=A0ACD1H9R8_9EURO|nr:hypothetical protein BO66DRAFT_349530 [Aspergillus aculeatinus CBS 121060]RAH70322.1 hypothetical protein BO66DRAFT_349530 [Aspergillus aculeatinus CBS 121060]